MAKIEVQNMQRKRPKAQSAEKMAKKPKMIRKLLRSPKCGENG